MVYVEGRLRTREWEDQNQNKRKTTEIMCDNFTMLGRRGEVTRIKTAHRIFHRRRRPSFLDYNLKNHFFLYEKHLAPIICQSLSQGVFF